MDEGVGPKRVPQYEDIVRRVGKRLQLRRDEAGYSLADLELRTGISKGTLSRIENGLQREMSAGAFFAICDALAIDPLLVWYGDARKPIPRAASEPPPAISQRPGSGPRRR